MSPASSTLRKALLPIKVLQGRGWGGWSQPPRGGAQPLKQPDSGTFQVPGISQSIRGCRWSPARCFLKLHRTSHRVRRGLGGSGEAGGVAVQAVQAVGGPRALPGCHRSDLSGGVEDVAGGDGEGRRGLGEVVNREEHWKGQETLG